ncbi:3-hydroxyacyl-CoA dehydrogenase/enoyl-CoA hydratase family protein [Occallatibacter savannae]|uniref:3-hydroxyacyl-CoA dehydrogenase/enoyl-CoA hydratase family protein n=1 Tax=Occallatibacter savannae TaxID=1002691 RepID=UPI000D688912|nr:3-hydroxyacyl-CoA dehydrogenase/enoyl-CoA hydratase family protein [Occallatibacter savannae]
MSAAAPATNVIHRFAAQPLLVRRAAVLGAGTMGSRIAAHLANAGVPALLLDMVPEGARSRNELAEKALVALAKAKPAAFYEASLAPMVAPGNFEDDLGKLKQCDWVIEAVAENLEIKRALLEKVAAQLAPQAVLTTNTSGLPIAKIAAGLKSHRERFFGTHFFNPPRYMQLLEIIPTAESDAGLVAAFATFADRALGKQVVFANDTPNFIANRIGVMVMFTAAALMLEQGLTIEDVDALTGPVLGFPRTGTFRLADMVGIDVLAHVAANFPQGVTPGGFGEVLQEIVKRGWLGDKSGQGFYRKTRGADGKEQRFVLDLKTFDYRPLEKANLPALEMAKNAATVQERLKLLLANDPKKDKTARFLWPFLSTLWNFAAERIGEAANDAPSIDEAMRAGFNWELGPFELWDTAGVRETVARMREMGVAVSPATEGLLDSAPEQARVSWYSPDGPQCYNPTSREWESIVQQPGHGRVAGFRRSNGVVKSNPGASLVDVGDGIGCIELHSLKNAIGGDVVAMISSVLNPASDAVKNFRGFVISGDRDRFSVGANLMQLLLGAQEGEWEEVEGAIRTFQQMCSAVKFCPRPVVVAPFNLTLGGGAEICLHAARRQPYAETYIGLVETGIGLIPGGGGTKEMLLRAVDAAQALGAPDPKDPPSRFAQSAEMNSALKRTLETIAMAKVSTSAAEGRALGLFSDSDRITMNRERLLPDAKAQAIALAEAGYVAPQMRTVAAPGTASLGVLNTGIFLMGEAGFASEHDMKVARWVAYILCGGKVTAGSLVTEQYLLELEREAFLSLCGERKTQERIAYTLKTGKPLRN